MSRKLFERYDPEEGVIGGLARYNKDLLPQGLARPDRLVLLGVSETVGAFRAASEGREVLIEVGPGKGRFAVSLALSRPHCTLLAVETRLGSCLRTLARASRLGATNVWVAWGDARMAVPALVEPGRASAAFILFPDPWWKRRHAHRRHGRVMAEVLATALAPGGILVIKSDVPEYLSVLAEAFIATDAFIKCELPDGLPPADRELRLTGSGVKTVALAMMRR